MKKVLAALMLTLLIVGAGSTSVFALADSSTALGPIRTDDQIDIVFLPAKKTNTYTVKLAEGINVRAGSGTKHKIVGAVGKGSVIRYIQSAKANGYTWIKIEKGSTLKGNWGKAVGYWMAKL